MGRSGPRAGVSAGAPPAPEVRRLLERAASLPRGLAFLHRAPLETVAITLDAAIGLVARAREGLDDPDRRPAMVECYRDAVARWRRGPHPECFPGPSPATPPPPAAGPEELLRRAAEHPLGLPFLADAPPETVAVTFGVHPFVVLEARALLERGGVARKHGRE